MAPISLVRISDCFENQAPLKPEEFVRFDFKPSSSLVALKKDDFAENDLWPEFVARYVKTSQYTRTKYYLERMSDPLKEELIWAIVSMWRESPEGKTKDEWKAMLKQDFRIEPEGIKERADVNEKFDEDREEVSAGVGYYEDNDSIRGSHYRLISNYAGASVADPFRILDNVRIAPKIRLDGANVTGNRKLEGEKEEEIGYQVGIVTGDLQLRDSQYDVWNAGGNFVLTGRQNIPTSFSNRSLLWKGFGELDHPFSWPINVTLAVEGLNEDFLKSAEEDQYRKDTNRLKLDTPLTYIFSGAWSLIGGYGLELNRTTLYYTKEDKELHNGYLWIRRRWLNDYLDVGTILTTESRDKERKDEGEIIKDKVKRLKSSVGSSYFRLLGGGRSIEASLLFSGVDSHGDLNAQFLEYTASSAVFFNLAENLEFNLNGTLIHDLIYQAGRKYELTYNAAPGLAWHATKNISVLGSGTVQQTKSEGGLNEDATSIIGNLTVSAVFEVLGQQMRLDLIANAGRNYDGINYDEPFIDTNLKASLLF
ncbi:MAG: hypothetical protein HYY43_03525 [Deltaproteobacteria bacterium]|nr:hypothetical protein [Deltaproteobacteria bacterium]